MNTLKTMKQFSVNTKQKARNNNKKQNKSITNNTNQEQQ